MDWQQIARTIAPTVATALLGPLGGVATNVVAGFLFPASEDKTKLTPQAVMNKIATISDPADVAKLREAEQALLKFEADNNFRFAQLDSESQQNARSMRTAGFASGNKTADQLAWLSLISFLFVAGFVLLIVGLAIMGIVSFGSHPEVWTAMSGLIGSVLGYFSANANQVISFYFGSSSGSAAKTDQMAQHTTDALAALTRIDARPQNPPGAGQGSATARIDTPGGGSTTVTVGEPGSGDLAREAAAPAEAAGIPPDQRWDRSVTFVLGWEGGFSDNPADHGHATNHGITLNTLSHFRGKTATVEDVRNLTVDEAKKIYQQIYWDQIRCDDLPAGVDLCVFDSNVLCGPTNAVQFLQQAAGLTGNAVDGRIGSGTLGAVRGKPQRDLIEEITTLREQHHRNRVAQDASQQQFLQGWLNRVKALKEKALEMVDAPAAA